MSKQQIKPFFPLYQGHCIPDLPHFEGTPQTHSTESAGKSNQHVPILKDYEASKYLRGTKDGDPTDSPYNDSAENLKQSKLDTSYSYYISSGSSPTATDPYQPSPDFSLLGSSVRHNSPENLWNRLCKQVGVFCSRDA